MTESGVHAEVEVAGGSDCRISCLSDSIGEISSVSRSTTPTEDGVTVDVTADATADLDGMDAVFHHGDRTVYRFECEAGATPACPCEFVERHGCPVQSFRTTDDAVVLLFVARDVRALREIVVGLKEQFPDVGLRRLTRSREPETGEELVFVDRSDLTARQREVLETAHEMGYFAHPKAANATEVADALDINRSTFAEHLAAAQSKLLDSIVDS